MTRVTRTAALAKPPEEVFAFVTDPENFPDYVVGYQEGRVETPQATGLGSAFEWTGKFGPVSIPAREKVVGWCDAKHVAYQGTFGGAEFRSAVDLSPRADGGTDLRVSIDYQWPRRLGGGVAGFLLRPLVDADVEGSLNRLRIRFGDPSDPTSTEQLVGIYRKRAAHYNAQTQLYRLAGFRLAAFRHMAVDALALHPGDTVVEVGCGTGENFSLLQQRVGSSGRIVGVDLTDAMLDQARRRVVREGWSNVRLVQGDATSFEFPAGARGILSTLALTHVDAYEEVIAHGARALAPGGRWVILDLKLPAHWPRALLSLALLATRPYAVTWSAAGRRPWEALERHLPGAHLRELYFGAAYLAVGEKAA